MHGQNRLLKYADDAYLLVGSVRVGTVYDEIRHITSWAISKNLHINSVKTREMVVVRHNMPSLASQPSVTGVQRTTTIKIFGVPFVEKLM